MLEVSEKEQGVVVLHLPIGPIKICSELEPVRDTTQYLQATPPSGPAHTHTHTHTHTHIYIYIYIYIYKRVGGYLSKVCFISITNQRGALYHCPTLRPVISNEKYN